MRIEAISEKPVPFFMFEPDNVIYVEQHGEQVVIRAARNNYSERRKCFFIRHLAAEGHIASRYERLSEPKAPCPPGMLWVIDVSLMRLGLEAMRRTNRFIHRLLFGSGCLWALEIAFVLAFRT
ncbi:MAG TPA: hypothetical protein VG146_20045 [Verrucomicrobiae bacterium]|nr:hypothetical protein [Verrucomicrobiae bacterium]